MTQKIQDTDFVVLKDFGDAMRPIHRQGLAAMSTAKKKLMANGVSAADASGMLNAVFKMLKDEIQHEGSA